MKKRMKSAFKNMTNQKKSRNYMDSKGIILNFEE